MNCTVNLSDRFPSEEAAKSEADRKKREERVRTALAAVGFKLLSKYENAHKKFDFECSIGHPHSMSWKAFNQGRRCGVCRPGGYNPLLPGILYYVRLESCGEPIYKIGITNRPVERRMSDSRSPFRILWQKQYDDGAIPLRIEKAIVEKFKKYQYTGTALPIRCGQTECFTIDILKRDTDPVKPSSDVGLLGVRVSNVTPNGRKFDDNGSRCERVGMAVVKASKLHNLIRKYLSPNYGVRRPIAITRFGLCVGILAPLSAVKFSAAEHVKSIATGDCRGPELWDGLANGVDAILLTSASGNQAFLVSPIHASRVGSRS